MPLRLLRNKTNQTVVGRGILGEGIYDSEVCKLAVATNSLKFFSKAINDPDASAVIAAKNYGETNLQQSSQLPKGQRFEVYSYNVCFWSNTSGTPATRIDLDKCVLGAWVELKISEILISRMPLIDVPFGIFPEIRSTATNVSAWNGGTAHSSNKINLKMGKYNPTIESGESFSFTINWNSAITLDASVRFKVRLNGLLLRPM